LASSCQAGGGEGKRRMEVGKLRGDYPYVKKEVAIGGLAERAVLSDGYTRFHGKNTQKKKKGICKVGKLGGRTLKSSVEREVGGGGKCLGGGRRGEKGL